VNTSSQIALPVPVAPGEIERKLSFGAAITLTYDLAGLTPKQLADKCRFDKGQISRWESGTEGVCWPKLQTLMDSCGNDVPVLWQLHQRGYDLSSLRRRESELEHRLRMAEEERDALKRLLLAGR
jgi:transcriptional regulator with XRE-family HTH domain